ncbi:MAG: pentapeptide repeat-containing protein [Verrucomicrobiota bacterium]|nr:pentapeptide repeat-containing protein [Verrucomicrobiota bacterium]
MRSSKQRIPFSQIPPWPSRGGFLFVLALLGTALGQASELRLTIESITPLTLSWKTGSITRPGAVSIIPETQLESSADLINWQPLGEAQPGGLGLATQAPKRTTIGASVGTRYFRIRSGVRLIAADLRGADLRKANLVNADLALAKLDGANLTGADLTGANLAEAVLGNANFTDANLTDATIAPWHHFPEVVYLNTTLPDGTVKTNSPERRLLIQLYVDSAPEVNLAGRDFSGWDLRGVELQKRDLTNCNFTGADLRNTKLDASNLAEANLTRANLRGATGFSKDEHEGVLLDQTTLPDGTISD